MYFRQAAFFSSKLPISHWHGFCENQIKQGFPDDLMAIFAMMVMFALYITVPRSNVLDIWDKLAIIIPPEDKAYLLENLQPEVEQLTEGRHLGLFDSIDALVILAGAIVKLIWAFLWQEEYVKGLILTPLLTSKFVLHYAVKLTPQVNAFAEMLDSIRNTDASMESAENVYPGWEKCNVMSSHALWH